ncbi:MAG TPA: hypothetical protein VNN79_07985 [Actinomycetota bacterium]|nr:hypothetical protein [Actinomycetota bacterium]
MGVTERRIRIRRIEDITGKEKARLNGAKASHYWAWSRPHVAEDLDRYARFLQTAERRGDTPNPRYIHFHALDLACKPECLAVDTVPADEPKGETEVVVA